MAGYGGGDPYVPHPSANQQSVDGGMLWHTRVAADESWSLGVLLLPLLWPEEAECSFTQPYVLLALTSMWSTRVAMRWQITRSEHDG
jgi:hypothetical protein